MPDVFTKVERSEVMSRIRGRGNKDTELALMALFRRHGITSWRRNQKVFGKPDFVFRKLKLAVFVDGCFWHGCPKCYRRPKSNRPFWDAKIIRNRRRDTTVVRHLHRLGWATLRVREHEFRDPPRLASRLRRALQRALAAGRELGSTRHP